MKSHCIYGIDECQKCKIINNKLNVKLNCSECIKTTLQKETNNMNDELRKEVESPEWATRAINEYKLHNGENKVPRWFIELIRDCYYVGLSENCFDINSKFAESIKAGGELVEAVIEEIKKVEREKIEKLLMKTFDDMEMKGIEFYPNDSWRNYKFVRNNIRDALGIK